MQGYKVITRSSDAEDEEGDYLGMEGGVTAKKTGAQQWTLTGSNASSELTQEELLVMMVAGNCRLTARLEITHAKTPK